MSRLWYLQYLLWEKKKQLAEGQKLSLLVNEIIKKNFFLYSFFISRKSKKRRELVSASAFYHLLCFLYYMKTFQKIIFKTLAGSSLGSIASDFNYPHQDIFFLS